MPDPQRHDHPYDKSYYDKYCSSSGIPYDRTQPVWMDHFRTLAQTLVKRYQPHTVLDVGCAKGFLVEQLREAGVEAFGRDISEYAISEVRPDLQQFCQVASGTDPIDRDYDLITCIEVAEHLPQAEAEQMVRNLCQHSRQVIFSSSPTDENEPSHINIHPADYWHALFRQHDFFPDRNFEPEFVSPQAVRYLKLEKPVLDVAVFSHEPATAAVAQIRLAGIIQALERQGRMRLHHIPLAETRLDVDALMECDLFVIHREFADFAFSLEILRAARLLRKPVVFELDDLLWNLPPRNPGHRYIDTITPDLQAMLTEADYVTVTTERLREEIETLRPETKGRVFVLPNYINREIWSGGPPPPAKANDPCVIAWFGTPTHDEDLAVIKPAIAQIASKHAGKVLFKFWGYLPAELKDLPGVSLARALQPNLKLYAQDVLGTHIDLAITPLHDHPFNHAKSDIKWLELSICKIPGIFSKITPYANSVTHGVTGWLVENTTEAWVDALEKLIADAPLRRQLAEAAHAEVRRTRCLELGAEKWNDLYRSFVASGGRPQDPIQDDIVTRQYAKANLMIHQAKLFSRHGKTSEAFQAYETSIGLLSANDPSLRESLIALHRQLRDTFQGVVNVRMSHSASRLLEAARTLARANQNDLAIHTYLDAIKIAEGTRVPATILAVLLEACGGLIALDRDQAKQLLVVALDLAKKLHDTHRIKIIEHLLTEAANKPDHPAPPPAAANPTTAARSVPAPTAVSVSIVIPTFNKLALTRQCLEALARHTPAGSYELIVVDNHSTDDTLPFLKEQESNGKLRLLANSENLGFARACNQGAQAARGKYVLFLNNDTEVQADWLEPLLALAEADPAIAAVGAKLLYPDGTIQHAGIWLGEVTGQDPLHALHPHLRARADLPKANQRLVVQAATAACLLVRKTAWQEVGGLDEGFYNGYEDVDLCLQFQQRGWLVVYEPASVVIHHESQSGSERFRALKENVRRLHQKWLGKVPLDFRAGPDGKPQPLETTAVRPYQRAAAAAKSALTSIIILTCNQLAHTRKCLASLEASTPEPHELIVIDNASSDGTVDFLREYAKLRPRMRLIFNPINRGFAAGNNQGLAIARGDFLLLLNNDTVVNAGWLSRMLAVFDRDPNVGLVGPMSNCVSGPQRTPEVPYREDLETMPPFAAQWAADHAGQAQPATRLVGFCLLARRKLVDRIGGLDERFGSGNFEDDDYCVRAAQVGFKACIARDVFIHHTGSQTFKGEKIDQGKNMARNWSLFKTKWNVPVGTTMEQGYRMQSLSTAESLFIPLPAPASDAPTRNATDAAVSAQQQSPAAARIGQLDNPRALLIAKEFTSAWNATITAIGQRPFHPDGWLLLAEIALAAGDPVQARSCAEHARQLAPHWKSAKEFLKKIPTSAPKPKIDWPALPDESKEPRLSVCLIVKNEEQFLAQCLKSVKEIAWQIVVVDTGSTDRTMEIAREFGAEVHSFPWNDHFSDARNTALEHATGDWVLSLDADEELSPKGREELRREMRAPSMMAYRIPIVNAGAKENDGGNYVPRLFRNAPGVHFTGRVHEQTSTSLEPLCLKWGLGTGLGKTLLIHHGYSSAVVLQRAKCDRNLRLLEQALAESPNDLLLVMNYGLELANTGQIEAALIQYRRTFQLMSAARSVPGRVAPEVRDRFLTLYAVHALSEKRFQEVIDILESPLAKSPGLTATMHFVLGMVYAESGRFQEALEPLRQCLAKRDQPVLTPGLSTVHKGGPQHCLAMCLVNLKQEAEAEKPFRDAVEENPGALSFRFDYIRLLLRLKKSKPALEQFKQLRRMLKEDAHAWRYGGQLTLETPGLAAAALDWTGDALKVCPGAPELIAQRADALLLNGRAPEALALQRTLDTANNPALRAAQIMSEQAAHQAGQSVADSQEKTVSQEYLKRYQWLMRLGAVELIGQLDKRLGELQRILPSAASVIRQSLDQAVKNKT